MTTIEKFPIDSDEYGDILKEIEKSFDIEFEKNELLHIKTFGELCDIVLAKINLPNINDSTHQQAFYKLRNAVAAIKGIDKQNIRIETKLKDLFPRKGRKKSIRELEFELGFSLKMLRPYIFVELIILLLFLGSIVFLFINYIWGLEMLAFFFVFNTIAFRTGREFNCETIGEVVKKMTKYNYKKSRRNSETINEEEIIRQLQLIFSDGYLREGEEITRETKF
jgi:hypothetical protein